MRFMDDEDPPFLPVAASSRQPRISINTERIDLSQRSNYSVELADLSRQVARNATDDVAASTNAKPSGVCPERS